MSDVGSVRGSRATKDLAVIAALLVLAFVLASAFELFEWLFEMIRDHESWQLDELFTLIMLSGLAFAVFAGRRWGEAVRENARRELVEKDLRESEERYRAVIGQSAENIFLVDIETKRIIESNAAFRRLTGYTSEELRGMTLYDLVAHDPESVDSYGRRAYESGQHFIGERRYRTKGGSLVDVEVSASVASSGGKDIFCVVSRDITGRKRNEEALRRRDAILQAVRYAAELFLKTPSWESGIRSVLEALGEATKVSRAYVFENYTDGEGRLCARQRYEWTAPGVAPEIDNPALQALPWHEAGSGRWAEVLGREQPLYGNVRDIPERERRDLVAQGIKSIAVVPVFVEGRWWGLIGFDETVAEREWSESEINALRSAASTLGTAIGRQRAEEEVRRSEERFRSLVQNTSDIITILESDGTVRYQSPAAERILGYRTEEMVGKNGFGYVHPEDLGRLRGIFETNLKSGGGVRPPVEVRARHADGSWRHMEMVANYLLGDPNVRGIVVNARDVTERRKAEEELRRSEERFRSLFENAADAVFVHDLEGNFVDVNGCACESLGYTQEELLGMSVSDVEVNFFPGMLVELWHQMTPGAPVTLAGRHRRKDGSIFPVEVRVGLFEQSGERLLIALARDVTERREAEERMRWLASFPERAPNLVIEADLAGSVTYANPAAEERFPDLRAAGMHHPALEGFEDLVASLQEGKKGFINRDVEVDGSFYYYQTVTYIPESGVVRVYASDITERRRAEANLLAAQRIGRLGSWEAEPVKPGKSREEHEMRWSDEMFRILGFSPQEFTPTFGKLIEATHPQDREHVSKTVRACALKGEPSCTVDHRILRPDGEERFVQARLEMVYGEEGELVRNFGTILDITERKRAEEEVRRSEGRLAEAQRIAHLGNWEFDVRENKAYWSDEMFRIFGLSPQQFIPDYGAFLKFVHPEDKDIVRSAVRRAMYEVGRDGFDYRILRPGGEVRTVHAEYEVVRDAAGETLRIVGTAHDITERQALERELEHRAFYDVLTGLPNRALFMDRLRHALSRSPQEGNDVAVLFLDLDNFKVVNDSLGHETGDRLLVTVAGILQGCLSSEDTVARFGGDEFCVLLEHVAGFDDATNVARRILDALQGPKVIGAHEVATTASIGIVLGSPGSSVAEDLTRRADLAMYRAKSKGKARYELFDPTMNTRAVERLRLETGLRRALREEEFEVHYQPVVSLADNAVTGVEALVRWRHPRRGLVFPGEFIPLAEETGLIVPIGHRVIGEACRQVRTWREQRPDLRPLSLSVNLSARQFQHPGLVEEVSCILRDADLDLGSLTLEITETTAMEDEQATLAILHALKALDVKVAIDDFGTGYSSLAYLKRFPVDILKVDRTFVAGLGKDPEDDAIARAVVAFARALGLEVVAEGIENGEQAALLREMGCDLGQGYYFARPLAATDVFATMEKTAGFGTSR